MLLADDILADDVSLVVAPLFHIDAINVLSRVIWQKGGHIVLHRTFDPRRCLDDIATYRVSAFFAVLAMLLFISQQLGLRRLTELAHKCQRRCPGAGAADSRLRGAGGAGSIKGMS